MTTKYKYVRNSLMEESHPLYRSSVAIAQRMGFSPFVVKWNGTDTSNPVEALPDGSIAFNKDLKNEKIITSDSELEAAVIHDMIHSRFHQGIRKLVPGMKILCEGLCRGLLCLSDSAIRDVEMISKYVCACYRAEKKIRDGYQSQGFEGLDFCERLGNLVKDMAKGLNAVKNIQKGLIRTSENDALIFCGICEKFEQMLELVAERGVWEYGNPRHRFVQLQSGDLLERYSKEDMIRFGKRYLKARESEKFVPLSIKFYQETLKKFEENMSQLPPPTRGIPLRQESGIQEAGKTLK